MGFVKKKIRHIVALISIFFILQASLLYYNKYHEYSTPDFSDLLLRYLMVIAVYGLLFYQVYRFRKAGHVIAIVLEILTLAAAASAFVVIPVVYARTIGIITEEVGYLYIAEVNMLFVLFLSITLYVTRYLSLGLSKTVFLISINAVFIINCAAVAILYSTGFEIGPTVFLHFSWEAVRVGLGEYLVIFLLMVAILVPINMVFLRLIKNHKDSVVNYTVVSLAILTVLANSVILNFDLYKTKTILPVYSIFDTALRYSDSRVVNLREEYKTLSLDDREKIIINELGINLQVTQNPSAIIVPSEKKNLITIYLESFQLNFTKHGGNLFPGLTPNINTLSSDYAVYSNFINSVTPTINAMISSQCGVDILLSTKGFAADNNQVLKYDAAAKDLLEDYIVCMPDILHDAGYYQVMMKGADINFSGKGKFFRAHHYDQTLGRNELNTNNKYKDLNPWGLQDSMLFDEALDMLETLKNKQPFNLTFLTVNSHTPGFEYSGCPKYSTDNTMLNGIHCTDHALGQFLKKLKTLDIYKNTVLVIAGDHVMFNSQSTKENFKDMPLSWYGRTYLALRTPDAPFVHQQSIFGTTPDLAPTILDLLGFKNVSFIAGKSLVGDRASYQRITKSGFDIINGKMTPENVESILNPCPVTEASKEKIYDTKQYNECQRAKIHYLQQKTVYQ